MAKHNPRTIRRSQIIEEDVRIDEIRQWMDNPVTKVVWRRFQEVLDTNHANMHEAMSRKEYAEAANWNAGYTTMQEVVNLPANMITEFREQKEARRESNS